MSASWSPSNISAATASTTSSYTFGHAVGNAVIRLIGPLVGAAAGSTAIVGHDTGDRFIVLLPTARVQDAEGAVARILASFDLPIAVGEWEVDLSMSVGMAFASDSASDAEALLQHAESALNDARTHGGRWSLYRPEHEREIAQQRVVLSEFHRAIDREQLELHYQPIVDVRTRLVHGYEALVRWRHPTAGLLPPGKFLPIIEGTSLMRPLFTWVLRRALADARRWNGAGTALSLNVSTVNIDDQALVGLLRSELEGEPLTSASVILEITESSAMANPERAVKTVAALKALGLGISIDDFGTGYSSLAYLQRLKVDELKIDRSFVAGLPTDRASLAIVRGTIDLGHSLGMRVLAEGVETEAQLVVLDALGCDLAQGYLFGRAAPPSEIPVSKRTP